ncbi:MAG TPA: PhzF family phenazine biosynthesis protein [Gemmatimonadales bacterium]
MDLWQIDAFADRPFSGNPAAVCWLEEERDDGWRQAVAAEMNLAETAFLTAGPDGFGLRWFTPGLEVDLCGHATLASAQYLWESGRLAPGTVARFHTRSGLLTAVRDGEWIVLDFPATPPQPAPAPAELEPGLGLTPRWVGRTAFDVFVELDNAAQVRQLTPNLEHLTGIPARGIIVTAAGDRQGVDFVSRFFGPAAGVPEDPVTGSAHCALGPFWAERLGKTRLIGFQASKRGGTVRVEVLGDRVLLGGQAITVLRGTLLA